MAFVWILHSFYGLERGGGWIRVLHVFGTSDRHRKWISFSAFPSFSLSFSRLSFFPRFKDISEWASMCFVTLLDTAIKTSPDKALAGVLCWILHDEAEVQKHALVYSYRRGSRSVTGHLGPVPFSKEARSSLSVSPSAHSTGELISNKTKSTKTQTSRLNTIASHHQHWSLIFTHWLKHWLSVPWVHICKLLPM